MLTGSVARYVAHLSVISYAPAAPNLPTNRTAAAVLFGHMHGTSPRGSIIVVGLTCGVSFLLE